ncbi:MAG: ABC transporter permease [Candidatus Rokuibacteriota bacterium]
MLHYVVRRLGQAVPTLFLTTVGIFLLLHLVPGDPAAVLAGSDAPPDVVAALRVEMGLDRPLPVQYILWFGRVLRGDLGVSYVSKFPVRELITMRVPATLELASAGLLVGLVLGIPTGVAAALHRGRLADYVVTSANAVLMSVPNFWAGIAFILIFALGLALLPPSGRVPLGTDPVRALTFLLLPAVTLGLHIAAIFSRFTRTALLEVLSEPYIRTAHAKGLGQAAVVLRHGFRNALIPVVTVFGLQAGYLLGGAVVVESVFAWPGLGRLIVESIGNRDYTTVQGALLVFVAAFFLVNLATDVAYAWIDPRIRLGAAGRRR